MFLTYITYVIICILYFFAGCIHLQYAVKLFLKTILLNHIPDTIHFYLSLSNYTRYIFLIELHFVFTGLLSDYIMILHQKYCINWWLILRMSQRPFFPRNERISWKAMTRSFYTLFLQTVFKSMTLW